MENLQNKAKRIRSKLFSLRQEHRTLDEKIQILEENSIANEMNIQRLKKSKLLLKDQINHLERELVPDIPA